MAKEIVVDIEGRHLKLSNLDKVLYPEAGFTKGQVIDYFVRIAPVLLPHLRGRPLTMKRYPNGVSGQYFYEKNCPEHRPEWVQTARRLERRQQQVDELLHGAKTCRHWCGRRTSPTSNSTPASRSARTSCGRRSWSSTSIPGRPPTSCNAARLACGYATSSTALDSSASPRLPARRECRFTSR